MTGRIFDIKEFAINDGPGIRVTVFLKGCPLRCRWCHNPEGLDFAPEMNNKTGKMVGEEISAESLAEKLRSFKDVYEFSGGGVTFSGGEPTAQSEFLYETASVLEGIHRTLDTSGYCDKDKWIKLLEVFDLIYFDLKLADNKAHMLYTGVSNEQILKNLQVLAEKDVPFVLRLPQIPGITETAENHLGLQKIIRSLPRKPNEINLLSYNPLAGGKYETYNHKFPLASGLKSDLSILKKFQHDMLDFNVKIY